MSRQPCLEDLPQEVLLSIMQHLPTETLVALAAAHDTLSNIITDVKFMDCQTRKVLGFPLSRLDITYDIIPPPVAPIQELWYLSYLSRAEPNLVVSKERGMTLASFLLVLEPTYCIGWAGIIDYSTFRCRDTWTVCQFLCNTPLDDIRSTVHDFFSRFLDFLSPDYIAFDSTGPFLYKGLCKLMQERQHLMSHLQDLLERTARYVTRKVRKRLRLEDDVTLANYLDSIWLSPARADSEEEQRMASLVAEPPSHSAQREPSKTLEVSVERYAHRGLNVLAWREVLRFYSDPVCHRALCVSCRGRHNEVSDKSSCLQRVHRNHLPLKIWPPHLLRFAVSVLPALEKVVRLDIELWIRDIHRRPPAPKVVVFLREVLAAVNLDFRPEPGETGPLLGMVHM
nr:hypothetical protein BaRGS_035187 [Batillaria attramentaria]